MEVSTECSPAAAAAVAADVVSLSALCDGIEVLQRRRRRASGPLMFDEDALEIVIVHINVLRGSGLMKMDLNGKADPYAVVSLGSKISKTSVAKVTLDPLWNESFAFEVAVDEMQDFLVVDVHDYDKLKGDDLMGRVMVPILSLTSSKVKDWFPLGRVKPKDAPQGLIELELWTSFSSSVEYFPLSSCASTLSSETNLSVNKFNERLYEVVQRNFWQGSGIDGGYYMHLEPPPENNVAGDLSISNTNDSILENLYPDVPLGSSFPGLCETTELHLFAVMLDMSGQQAICEVFLTNFRLVAACLSSEECMQRGVETQTSGGSDISTYVPLRHFMTVNRVDDTKMSYRVVNGDVSRCSYRTIKIKCSDFRALRLILLSETSDRTFHALLSRLQDRLFNAEDQPFNISSRFLRLHPAQGMLPGWNCFDIVEELKRQGVPCISSATGDDSDTKSGTAKPLWRLTDINGNYALCDSYPSRFAVPGAVGDSVLQGSAAFRSRGRIPTLCWYNRRKGNSICRCAQPMPGVRSANSSDDETLVEAIRVCLPPGVDAQQLVIFDARSILAATGNALKGKGTEDTVNRYSNCKILFCDVANIHAMRDSIDSLRKVCKAGLHEEGTWLSALESTNWLQHLRMVLSAATLLARYVQEKGLSVLVHCSDGWDRTSQLTSLAMLMLDSYYRTIDGFLVLVEKEWLAFGHKFKDRLGSLRCPNERSPVFLQFLDCVWQIMQQYPYRFEFTSSFLLLLADHCDSGWYGTFLENCERDRMRYSINTSTVSLWAVVKANRKVLKSKKYMRINGAELITPVCSVKVLRLWNDYFLRYNDMNTFGRNSDRLLALIGGEIDSRITSKISHASLKGRASGVMAAAKVAAAASVSAVSAGLDNSARRVFWQPDDSSKKCYDCGGVFTHFRRRHHCRSCGQLFCCECVKKKVELPSLGYTLPQKVCDSCFTTYTRINRGMDGSRNTVWYDSMTVDTVQINDESESESKVMVNSDLENSNEAHVSNSAQSLQIVSGSGVSSSDCDDSYDEQHF